jgi:hypothetical protein
MTKLFFKFPQALHERAGVEPRTNQCYGMLYCIVLVSLICLTVRRCVGLQTNSFVKQKMGKAMPATDRRGP